MDSRDRILVVEDDENLRKTLVGGLSFEGWRVDGTATLQAATDAIDACAYHVAIVDINLANERDTSNREGITFLRQLAELNEGTRSVVLSGTGDRTLARDLLQDGLTPTFVYKDEVAPRGNAFLIPKIKDAIAASTVGASVSWDVLMRTIARGLEEKAFVSECLQFLSFKGGFANLEKSLLASCSPLMPLLPEMGPASGLARAVLPEVFNGRFWSKSQGQAVEVLLHGSNASPDAIASQWDIVGRNEIYSRSKGDLSVMVLDCPGMTRTQFASTKQ
jgi:DNA-binding NarL/FixJ family response regulator